MEEYDNKYDTKDYTANPYLEFYVVMMRIRSWSCTCQSETRVEDVRGIIRRGEVEDVGQNGREGDWSQGRGDISSIFNVRLQEIGHLSGKKVNQRWSNLQPEGT